MDKMTDQSIVPFGKYEGEKIANVPASYLIWAYNNLKYLRPDMKAYIEENMEDLKTEAIRKTSL